MRILNEQQYEDAKQQIVQADKKIAEKQGELVAKGLKADAIKRLLDPMRSFHEDIRDEIKVYENCKKGLLPPVTDLSGIGRSLIALRIASGMSQEQFAKKLNVSQPQVSRDENNEYHGISLDRAQTILAAFGARLEGKVILQSSNRKAA